MPKYLITPVGKPRMTRADKWKQRPPVMRYRMFCDEARLHGIRVPENGAHITFVLPMPKSWSKKKRAAMDGQPHQQKPDLDNLKNLCWTPCLRMIPTFGTPGHQKYGAKPE